MSAIRAALLTLACLLVAAGASLAQETAVPCGACVAVSVTPDQANAVARSGASLGRLTVLVAATPSSLPAARSAMTELSARDAQAGVLLQLQGGVPDLRPIGGARLVVLDVSHRGEISAVTAFEVKTTATTLRAGGAERLGLQVTAGQLPAVVALGLGPYVDFLVAPAGAWVGRQSPVANERWTRASSHLISDLNALLTSASSTRTDAVLVPLAAGDEVMMPVLAALASQVPSGLTPLRDIQVSCDVACSAHTFLDPSTLNAVAIVEPRGAASRVRVRPGATRVTAIVPELARAVAPLGSSDPWSVSASANELTLPAVSRAFILRAQGWQGTSQGAFATGIVVSGTRPLSVAEIVARHQASRARQDAVLRSLISAGSTVLTFDAPGFSAPLTITADTTIYSSQARTEVEQRNIRVNGLSIATRGDEVPRLPLIDAERVATPPLAIALTEAYTYRLDGTQQVRSRRCYVVRFDPRAAERTLFAGRAFIDAETFGVVRLDATQTALPGPVVASTQVDDFEPAIEGGVTVWLPARSEINQRYETANYATPIRRVVTLTRHAVNAPDFAARLGAAHRSDAVMMLDTPEGYRYLRRERSSRGAATANRTLVRDRAQRVVTAAGGVTIDPNISVPLVFAGLSYLNLNAFGRDAQINAFFGGLYGQLAWSSPPIRGSTWRLSGDAFAIAVSYNDRAFRNGIEQYVENIEQRPFHASAGLVGPLPGGLRLHVAYEMDYTAYRRSESTAANFVVPVSSPVHGVRITAERQRGPWTLAAWWNGALRQRWQQWGRATDLEPAIKSFDRYGLRVARSFVWSPRKVGRFEALWMDGRRLDRFSRFTFGTFDNPLRGYPSASIRYDRGLVFRSAASWTAASHLRFDGFYDFAVAHDPGLSRRARGFPGIGAGLEAPLPFGLLTAVEWGYGFSGRNTNGSTGTQVLKVSVYKVF